jgi:hypothetical protein
MAARNPSIHIFLGRPLFLLSSGILLTWPYRCSLFFRMMSYDVRLPFHPFYFLYIFILSIIDFLAECCITKATNRISEYVIFNAFPQQKWLRDHTSMLHYGASSGFLLKAIISLNRFNPLAPNNLQTGLAVSNLKIKIPSKNIGRQLYTERFNSGVKGLTVLSLTSGC